MKLMRAMVFRKVGQPLAMEERPLPSPGEGEILVRIEACAVCRTDLHIFDGDLPNPKLPLIPGHEIVGIAEEVGARVDPVYVGVRLYHEDRSARSDRMDCGPQAHAFPTRIQDPREMGISA
jgi:D-arabinose 1-dehydrogenase-like Zn-dependent alcohol dehydrogenase